MSIRYRVGSVVPCEGVDPHSGPFLDYGIILYWLDRNGSRCARKDATHAMIEASGHKSDRWNSWCEEHCWKLDPFFED